MIEVRKPLKFEFTPKRIKTEFSLKVKKTELSPGRWIRQRKDDRRTRRLIHRSQNFR